jgi:pimeloyl-ACP methyl ester carboxylesterase
MRKFLWPGLMVAALFVVFYWAFLRPAPRVLPPPLVQSEKPGVRARDCDYSPLFGTQLECYWVELRDGKVGFTFGVAVFRARGPDSAMDPLVYIPGGPGESGNTAPLMLSVWEEWYYRTRPGRDFVLVDLRGLAPGFPSWDCAAYSQISLELMRENLTFAQGAERMAPVLENCLKEWQDSLRTQGGPVADLTRITSLTNAADLAQVLMRLGYQQWNYLAVSYGTRVALIAALTQPQVRRIILDSPYPLDRGVGSDMGALWAEAFTRFWRECAGLNCPFTQEDFWQLMRQLRLHPVPVKVEDWSSGDPVEWLLNDGNLAAAVYSTFYSSELRYQVAPALREFMDGDIERLLPLLEMFYNQAFDSAFNSAIFWATECNDTPLQSEEAFYQVIDELGPWREYFVADWQFNICRSPVFTPGQVPSMRSVSIPVLVVVGALDPITTQEHAQALMPWLPQGKLLVLSGHSHAEFYGSECGEALIPWFLGADEAQWQAEWDEKSRGCRLEN